VKKKTKKTVFLKKKKISRPKQRGGLEEKTIKGSPKGGRSKKTR